ncbi:tRNA (N(6)-L-threonylcarbamoyladenosine(37)-C(2))-methylthiotransferase MtaB [Beijerinckia indica]|uniref:MiaB-like tRNA modifying enzyme n=1 Tax=Beijerinckia indica subsp. indica (strain ATCC 9039 / DSM 1715 / NCIMB 8712) TaxID=395963 RepID=B2IEM2_BEII9|nr:tRNA (N(6)-L-threonylcarbamoyladenosine(37)-C(2))-methylthiotransferase MtaB [Beijerinckia indica]ACB96962.1 MiaB-like tRNA modifying enzyme [Beijerinckia indica subsp. indica ATCC 9039]
MKTHASAACVETLSFGCRLNFVEAETMRRAAKAAGFENLVIVNSCAVTAEATRQTRQAIRRVKREQPEAKIVVTGCAAETEPERFRAMPEVGLVLGNARKTEAATWLALKHQASDLPLDAPHAEALHRPRLSPQAGTEDHTRAFLAVQNGCDHRCSFCIIPQGRGSSRSVPLDDAIAMARDLAARGFLEIVLTGVDLTSYGSDLPDVPRLGDLVRRILREVPSLPRLRLSSIDCIEADPVLVRCFAEEERLMPSLHLSLQAGSDLILKRMQRRHGRTDAIRFCAELRRLRPDIAFSADLIAGFPTETEAQFTDTLDLVDACGLTSLHVFPFSARPGTPAARMPAVAPTIVKERARRLREKGTLALASHLGTHVGHRRRLLSERGGLARTEDFAPVRLHNIAPGRLVEALITGSDGEVLQGAIVPDRSGSMNAIPL